MADVSEQKTALDTMAGAGHHMLMGAASSARGALRSFLPYDAAIGAAVGAIQTAVNGGSLAQNIHDGIAGQERLTQQAKDHYGWAYNGGQLAGAVMGASVAKASLIAGEQALHAATGATQVATGAVQEMLALKNLYRASRVATTGMQELGQMTAPTTPPAGAPLYTTRVAER